MMEEYYVECYDPKGRRGYTNYYLDKIDADNKKEDLESQGYTDVKVVTFRY